MTSQNQEITTELGSVALSFADFLESTPPNDSVVVNELVSSQRVLAVDVSVVLRYTLIIPELQLHCSNDACNGIRFFRWVDPGHGAPTFSTKNLSNFYLNYRCSNCGKTYKTYALSIEEIDDGNHTGTCTKFGERPAFGPPVPSRLIRLIGPDRDIFLKGRRCENQGLGIGALIYYRRVVENQKDRILGEIIKVAQKLNAKQEVLDALSKSLSETQFSQALDISKNAMPESLLINGHNPLRLLHSALSEGVHARSDEECLQIASSVRVVLGELAERISAALKDEAELSKALSTLMAKKP